MLGSSDPSLRSGPWHSPRPPRAAYGSTVTPAGGARRPVSGHCRRMNAQATRPTPIISSDATARARV